MSGNKTLDKKIIISGVIVIISIILSLILINNIEF